jgi:hypothetical protein
VGGSPSGTTTSGPTDTSTSTPAPAANDPASSQGTVLVTFAVSPAAAQRLIQVTVAGLPYLALLQH